MIDEIIELLKKYTERFADENYYIELGKILMKYKNVSQGEFNGIEFLTTEEAAEKFNTNEFTFLFIKGGYFEPEKIIYLLLSNLKQDTRTWKNYDLTNKEHYIFSNLVRSGTILHEFEHFIQKRGKTGLEGILTSNVRSAKGDSEYAISPLEHFANLYASLIAFSIAERMNLPESVLSDFKDDVFTTLYNPYLYNKFDKERKNKNENEPVVEYFNKVNVPIDLNLEYVNNLSFIDRIIFGFAISDDEFEHFSDLCRINVVEPSTILERLDMYSKVDENEFRRNDNKSTRKNR